MSGAAARADQPPDDSTAARAEEQQRRPAPPSLPADDDPDGRSTNSQPPRPDRLPPDRDASSTEPPPLATTPATRPADPLADLIVAGDHTPEELARPKAIIESMITFEKEARGKSPDELDKMIQDKAAALDEARWQVRVLDAQLRRLNSIRGKTRGNAPSRAADKPR